MMKILTLVFWVITPLLSTYCPDIQTRWYQSRSPHGFTTQSANIDKCICNSDSELIVSKKNPNVLNGTESIKDLLKLACVITEFMQK